MTAGSSTTSNRRARATPKHPLTDAELDAKFSELVVPVLGAEGAWALLRGIRDGRPLPGDLPRACPTDRHEA